MSSHQKETTSQRKETGRRMVGRQAIATSITAILYKEILSEDQVKILLFFVILFDCHIYFHIIFTSVTHILKTLFRIITSCWFHLHLDGLLDSVSPSFGLCEARTAYAHSWLALIGQCHCSVWSASTKTGGHAHARTLHTYHIFGSWAILRQSIFGSNCEHLLTAVSAESHVACCVHTF